MVGLLVYPRFFQVAHPSSLAVDLEHRAVMEPAIPTFINVKSVKTSVLFFNNNIYAQLNFRSTVLIYQRFVVATHLVSVGAIVPTSCANQCIHQ